MTDLFDFGGNPIESTPSTTPPKTLFERLIDDAQSGRMPKVPAAAPTAPQSDKAAPSPTIPFVPATLPPGPGLVASFSCYCGCQSEVREPAPATILCWGDGCYFTMHRWTPPIEPPTLNAWIWDGEKLVRQ